MVWGKQRSVSSPSRLYCSSFSVSVLYFATSPNSGVKLLGGFLRSEKTIFRFISAGGASFSRNFIFLLLRSRDDNTGQHDPTETHRDPLAEDHQDPLEDAHQVDPLEADHRAGEDCLDRADPAEALLEDPLGTPTTHQGMATRIPPGGGLSTSAGESSCSSWR